MTVHNHMAAAVAAATKRRLWSVLRITFLMVRKLGFISNSSKAKRKLMMDLNFIMKRGKRSFRKFISMSKLHDGGFGGIQLEYEFSCSNSPNPVFFHTSSKQQQHRVQSPFPCINPPPHEINDFDDDDDSDEPPNDRNKAVPLLPKTTPDYMLNKHSNRNSPLLMSPPLISVRVSNYSALSDQDDQNGQVDDEAEEFIKMFYEQLRAQRRIQLLQYQQDAS